MYQLKWYKIPSNVFIEACVEIRKFLVSLQWIAPTEFRPRYQVKEWDV